MLERICGQIARNMVSFWAKTLFKLHKMFGEHTEICSIHSQVTSLKITWKSSQLCLVGARNSNW